MDIIVDLNLYMHRWVHFLTPKKGMFLTSDKEKMELIQGVHNSLTWDMQPYRSSINRIFLVCDPKETSWRKFIKYDDEENTYKDRDKDYNFDYKVFLDTMEEYCSILRKRGMYVLQYQHAEADDLIYLLSQSLYDEEKSSMILSSDNDLKQLIQSGSKAFCYVYDGNNRKKRHYIDKMIEQNSEDKVSSQSVDLEGDVKESFGGDFNGVFDMDSSNFTDDKDTLLSKIYENSEEINPLKVIWEKMLAGDTSDNVPSCYYYSSKNGKKTYSYTELRAKRLWDDIIDESKVNRQFYVKMFTNEDVRKKLATKVIKQIGKQDPDSEIVSQIAESMKRNLQFTFLHEKMFYPDHLKAMKQYLSRVLENEDFRDKHYKFIEKGFTEDILKDTKFEYAVGGAKYYTSKY